MDGENLVGCWCDDEAFAGTELVCGWSECTAAQTARRLSSLLLFRQGDFVCLSPRFWLSILWGISVHTLLLKSVTFSWVTNIMLSFLSLSHLPSIVYSHRPILFICQIWGFYLCWDPVTVPPGWGWLPQPWQALKACLRPRYHCWTSGCVCWDRPPWHHCWTGVPALGPREVALWSQFPPCFTADIPTHSNTHLYEVPITAFVKIKC